MNIKIQGDLCVASGENWEYKRIGDMSVFTQTGKIPSLRIIKTILKIHLKIHDIGATLVCNNTDKRDDYGNPPNYKSTLIADAIDGATKRIVADIKLKGGIIKGSGLYKIGEAGI